MCKFRIRWLNSFISLLTLLKCSKTSSWCFIYFKIYLYLKNLSVISYDRMLPFMKINLQQLLVASFTSLFFTDHNQNNNNSLSDVRSNSRMRPSSAMAVSSTNKHNSLNRRVADQARHFHRQQIPSNTSSSSLPVAPQKSTSGRGTQEHSSTSSLGLLVFVLKKREKNMAKAQLFMCFL